MNKVPRIGLVSISDRASAGTYQDLGIPSLKNWLKKVILNPFEIEERLIPDDKETIKSTLVELVDEKKCDLVLTTGGTGPSRRDVTPDATIEIASREMPGFGEQMRRISSVFVPTAILSRQIGALREIEGHSALIINLPGQPKAIAETLEGLPAKGVDGIFAAVPYCIELIGGPSIETDSAFVKAFRPKSARRPEIIDSLIIEPENKADSAIIMLHGLGADGNDFGHFREELIASGAPLENTRIVLPNAPYIPISMNNGYEMRGWFDLYSLESTDKEDAEGIKETFKIIRRLISEEESKGIPRDKIFLGGFSQGCCMALYSAVQLDKPIGGFFGLSGYLPLIDKKEIEHIGSAIKSPIFVGYGEEDPVVPPAFTQISISYLQKLGADKLYARGYSGLQHSINLDEIGDLADFLALCLEKAK